VPFSRLEFTAAIKRAARDRAKGRCECARLRHLNIPGMNPEGCGVALNPRNGIYYEHINQAFVRDDNSLENCAVLVRTCWRLKTDICDLPVVAHVKDRRDRNDGIRPERRGAPMPGSKASGWRKKMNGTVVPRGGQ
jgi:hypothetical protein